MTRAMLLVALVLTGCGSAPPRIEYQRVEVPVYVRPEPPRELVTCGDSLTWDDWFRPATGDIVVGIDRAGMDALLALISGQRRCMDAWEAWASPSTK